MIDFLKKHKDKVFHFLGCGIGVLISVPIVESRGRGAIEC